MKNPKEYKNIQVNKVEKGIVPMKDAKKARLLRKINKVINILMVLFVPLVLVFLASLIQIEDLAQTFTWMGNNFGMCVLNSIFILTLYFLLQFITQKPSISICLMSSFYMLLPIISKIKFDLRGEVLLVNELAYAGNTKDMLVMVEMSNELILHIILTVCFIILFTILVSQRKFKINRITSGVFFALFLTLFLFIFFTPLTSAKLLRSFGVNESVRFSPNVMHEKQGFWLGFYSNYVMNKISAPINYSRDTVYRILDSAQTDNNEQSQKEKTLVSKENPNIIIIMSESFFDPTVIPNVKYSEDPIPNMRKYLKKYESGTMISSTFGGGTATVEYEMFTGESASFLPYGTVPYTDLPKKLSNVDTVPKVLKNVGYETIALHTYEGTFYNRKEAYPRMGFDTFLESHELEDVSFYGKYISDLTMNKNIIHQLELERKDNHPLFIWALTMQNHTPYQPENYSEGFDQVKIISDKLSKPAKDKLIAYVNGINESDRQLKNLLDYLDESDEPTVLLFFGDHLPSLYEVYEDTGMITTKVTTDWQTEELLKMQSVPFFIYDNFSDGEEKKHDNLVGAAFLGNKLLNYTKTKKSSYFRFLDTLPYTALRDRLFVDSNGNYFESINPENERQASQHKMLQYDMLYGENYVKEYEKGR